MENTDQELSEIADASIQFEVGPHMASYSTLKIATLGHELSKAVNTHHIGTFLASISLDDLRFIAIAAVGAMIAECEGRRATEQ